ncbi:MAG: DUF962 domain-containing protein [Flavobacteriales bacterium]|nr:DUF962 domain-containing protein [Flavobacteriales bacterium]
MKTMQDWLDAYGVSHQNPINKLFHWICVPTIFISLVGLLSRIPLPELFGAGWAPYLHVGTALLLGGLVFFIRLSPVMALTMAVISACSLYGVKLINIQTGDAAGWYYFAAFAVAWIGQFIGHKIEGEKPSFFDDLKFLMIGPAWLAGFVLQKSGIRY